MVFGVPLLGGFLEVWVAPQGGIAVEFQQSLFPSMVRTELDLEDFALREPFLF